MTARDPIDTSFLDGSARDRVVVAGADAQRYLQSQLAQDIDPLEIGEDAWTLVLDPTGKIDALARVTHTEIDTYVLDTEPGYGDGLKARLDRFKIRVDATTTLDPAEPREPSSAQEDARIAAGWPRMGAEIVPGDTIPASTGLIGVAASVTKGCYPGQELVERMDSRGAEAPRSLRILRAPDGTVPGDPIVDGDGNAVGVYTSVGSGGCALGYVKRTVDLGDPPVHVRR